MDKTFKDHKRQDQVDQGVYDGRYRTKIVEQKRRKKNKDECRKFRYKESVIE